MSFTDGRFDFVAQIERGALDVIADVIIKTLEAQGKTKFTQNVGGGSTQGTIEVELTDVSVPVIRSLNINDRFRPGNTLATFRADAELKFAVTIFGLSGTITEDLFVEIKDLAIAFETTPGGLPVGVALGFANFDIDVGGLTNIRAINQVLNVIVDFIALGIRTALTPLQLVPIPIVQFADAFAQFGLLFRPPSPLFGTNQNGDGLFLAADFEAPDNNSDPAVLTDIIGPNSQLNIAAVAGNRPINQLLPQLLASAQLTQVIPTAGANFVVGELKVGFEDPGPLPARIRVDAFAAARVKVRKGGFFGRLFGGSKKVTITAQAEVVLDTGIVTDPNTQLEVLEFQFAATLQAQVAIQSVLLAVFTVLLGPFLLVFLTLLTQLLNIAAGFFLPLKLNFDVNGSDLEIQIDQLRAQLGIGASGALGSLSSATIAARLDATGRGRFQLDHFTQHQIAQTGIPLIVGYETDSIATRSLPIPQPPNQRANPGELFLGVRLDT